MATYTFMRLFSQYTMSMFFRDIDIVNSQNIPESGPLIIYGNHNNQFVDGTLLIANLPRQVRFIAAAASCRRPLVGRLINMTKAIPVERPQDLKVKGKGKILRIQNKTIYGVQTQFTKIPIGYILSLKTGQQLRIASIKTDSQITTDSKCQDIQGEIQFSIIPKLQFDQLYQNVWENLRDNQCIGIFPEGGSHDRLNLLPLKAGICIMALGAIQKYGVPVNIVPCGFHYYHPQNFRSKVILQFGPAYRVPQELVELYKVDSKAAISALLDTLQKMLINVTTNVKTFKELSTLFLCRQLYTMNTKKNISVKDKLELNRRFAKGFDLLSSKPQNKQKMEKLFQMDEFIKIYNLPIAKQNVDSWWIIDFIKFLFYLEKTIVRVCLSLPGAILMGPTTTLIAFLAEKERVRCLKGSKVKQTGADVVGSYKILLSIIMFPFTAIFNSSVVYLCLRKFTSFTNKKSLIICALLAILMPFYSILMVKSYDSLGRSFTKLKYFFIKLFKRSLFRDFNIQKKNLSKKIIQVVDQQGKQIMENFQEKRIIKPHQFQYSSSIINNASDNNLHEK